jgi:FMN-dependent NADH-azoreductase
MTTLLQINSSIHNGNGESSRLAERFVAAFRQRNPGVRLIRRDLVAEAVPHLTAERFGAFAAKPDQMTAEQRAVLAYSDALIDELKSAHLIVLGLPMYNFGVPSQLKAYFDHVARAGVTFRYTADGPQGLLTGKKVYVFAARGGLYEGSPLGSALDTQTGYVRTILGFLGLTDVEFVKAEGLATGPEAREANLAKAAAHAERLAA